MRIDFSGWDNVENRELSLTEWDWKLPVPRQGEWVFYSGTELYVNRVQYDNGAVSVTLVVERLR
jgi:hypothetical protein